MPQVNVYKDPKVTPYLYRCFFCNEVQGVVLLKGSTKYHSTEEAPHGVILNKEPCQNCVEHMRQGVILISVKDTDETENPYRTGGWCVVKDEAILRLVRPQELANAIIKKRVAFVPDDAWDMLKLPRETIEAEGDVPEGGKA
jgi:hypothetical protein